MIHPFSNPKAFIDRVCSVLSFYARFAFQNCLVSCAETKGQTCFRKIEIFHEWHIVSFVAQKRAPVDSSNSSCK